LRTLDRCLARARLTDGSVGIWHETYQVARGAYENIYVNMPPFGLGKAGILHRAGSRQHAPQRPASETAND